MTLLKREDLEKYESQIIKPYGMKSSLSLGRAYEEDQDSFRTCFQRDRDRVIHSVAFRRLEYKTQVFLNEIGDHYRNRLTHSLEVAGLSRATARSLGLNEDLVEVVALSHDLGHTPFGHAGERILHKLMKDHGGFEHNMQSERIICFLEHRHPKYNGLNLTYETRECMIKHSPYAKVKKEYHPELAPLLESYVVDICDEIAYDNHDLDDGLRSGLLEIEKLKRLSLWEIASRKVSDAYGKIDQKVFQRRTISAIIDLMMGDLLHFSSSKIEELSLNSIEDVRNCDSSPIGFSTEMAEMKQELEKYLFKELYRNYRVNRMMFKAELCIEKLFNYFVSHEDSMPLEFQKICKEEGTERGVSDYVSGMTDRYAQQTFDELFSASGKL
ncbi:MAG: deoxyguanosinetriphosphate triphosphohydrolase [Planctomycetota bacterium]|nr:MAG: deoxyguanosinetriphosphate triphosphohydrolase [Planctomycetota bacterium]